LVESSHAVTGEVNVPEPPQSRILDIAAAEAPTGAKPGVPPYGTQVFVPAHPRYPRHGNPVVMVELMAHPAGPPVPVAFTDLEKLVAALGEAQPWVALPLGGFTKMMRGARLPAVRLDPSMVSTARKWQLADLNAAYGTAGADTASDAGEGN
jgi:hypothetical protein